MTNVGAGPKTPSEAENPVDIQGETLWRDDDSEEGIVRGKGDIMKSTTITVEHSGVKGRM